MHNSYCDYLARSFPKYEENFCQYVNTLIEYLNTTNIDVDLIDHLNKKIELTNIITQKYTLDPLLVESLIEIPRELFANVKDFNQSLIDSPIQFGSVRDVTISQPSLVGYMIQLLKLKELKNVSNVNILEIGTASGYNAVLLADSLTNLNCRNNTVYTIEFISSLIPKAIHNISKFYKMESKPANWTKSSIPQRVVGFSTPRGQLILYKGDGTQSLGVIYDRIIVTAGGDKLPLTFIKYLKDKGVVVMPIQDYLVTIVKLKSASTHLRIHSMRDQNSYLHHMILQNNKHQIVDFKGLYSLSITLVIPVNFVPLRYTKSTTVAAGAERPPAGTH